MPLTITAVHDPDDTGSRDSGTYTVVCDTNYPAGGYPLTPASFSRKTLHSVIPVQIGTASRILTWDPTPNNDAGLLRVWTAIGTEAAGASDQSSVSCRVRVVGPHA